MPNEQISPTDGQPGASGGTQHTGRSRLTAQFVIFPLAIVIVGVGIYLLLGMLTSEDQSAQDYLNTIKVGGINSRWQAAFELSKVLAEDQRRGKLNPGFVHEMVRMFEAARSDDPRVRRYLALAMGRVRDPAAVPPLIAALEDPDDETRIFAMFSLGAQGDARAVGPLIGQLSSPDAGIRKAGVYALGQLADDRVPAELTKMLGDGAPDVRWNAALQLAKRGNRAGVDVLREMLDRSYLETLSMDEAQRSGNMIEAIRAVRVLDARSLAPLLEELREKDPSMKVRQAAIEALEAWEK